MRSRLYNDSIIQQNDYLISDNYNFKLQLKSNGYLVGIWNDEANDIFWQSNSKRDQPTSYYAKLQSDGNFVIYENDTGPTAVWSTCTEGNHGECWLTMQNDGNIVLYSKAKQKVLWASNTCIPNQEVKSSELFDIQYDLDNVKYSEPTPTSPPIIKELNNETSVEQENKFTLSEEVETIKKWTTTLGISFGYETGTTMKASVPIEIVSVGAELHIKLSSKLEFQFTFGLEIKEKRSIKEEFSVKIPPYSKITAECKVMEITALIPYKAKMKKILENGKTIIVDTEGTSKLRAAHKILIKYKETGKEVMQSLSFNKNLQQSQV